MARRRAGTTTRSTLPAGPIGRTHAMLGPTYTNVFEELHLGAALSAGSAWVPLHVVDNVLSFELAHGVERRRDAHNLRSFALVAREKRPVLAAHAGFHDLYVPVPDDSGVTLVTGPFLVARPTAAELRDRWRWLTGSHASLADAEFSHYLGMTLGTATFDREALADFERFCVLLCRVLATQGSALELAREALELRGRLGRVRFAERMWSASTALVDERNYRSWRSEHRTNDLLNLGIDRPPDRVAVGLLGGRLDDTDPIEELLGRDAFLRAAADAARRIRNVLAGRIGDYGISLLIADRTNANARLLEIGERLRALARRNGFRLHFGVPAPDHPGPLPARYQAALGAAERALADGAAVRIAERRPPAAFNWLGNLRRELVAEVRRAPQLLAQRWSRYLATVAAHCGYRFDATAAQLETGFDQVFDALGGASVLDARGLADLRATLERAASAGTVRDLLLVYRGAVTDLASATSRPMAARHDRSMRRALAYIDDHLADRLSAADIARIAGFAPSYFRKLFVATEKVSFQRYVQARRIQSARKLLESTSLGIERVGRLAGFHTRTRFHAAFREALGMTPAQYRAEHRRR